MSNTEDLSEKLLASAMKIIEDGSVEAMPRELELWVQLSCEMGFFPDDIAYYFLRLLAWTDLRHRYETQSSDFTNLTADQKRKLRAFFFAGASEKKIKEAFERMIEKPKKKSNEPERPTI